MHLELHAVLCAVHVYITCMFSCVFLWVERCDVCSVKCTFTSDFDNSGNQYNTYYQSLTQWLISAGGLKQIL